MSKTIFRVEKNKDNPFVMIDRRPIENPKLSWKAKGILAYLLSRPDNWVVRLGDLVKRSPDGAHAVRQAIKELRAVGHITYKTERENGHIKQWTLIVHEIPLLSENQQVGNQQVENLTLNDTDVNENELSKEREAAADAEIFQALSEMTGGGLNSNTPKFVDAWKERHTNEWILKAVAIARENKARSVKYVDEILIGWEAKGYPKTREERVSEKRPNSHAQKPAGANNNQAIIRKVALDASKHIH